MAPSDSWIFILLLVTSSCLEVLLLDGEMEDDVVVVDYVAAVLEHEAYSSWESGGFAILQENTRLYLEYAALAKEQGADIMVFPEYGLTSTNLTGDFLTLTQLLPDPADHAIPCDIPDHNTHTIVVRKLSCGAAQLGMYLVVNLAEQEPCTNTPLSSSPPPHPTHGQETGGHMQAQVSQPATPVEQTPAMRDTVKENPGDESEEDGRRSDCPIPSYYFYNTQVVFDRSGAVVARYRKKHLFLEPKFTPGYDDDTSAIFTTDFGVTFTLQVCFDIMYESPGLNNIVQRGIRDVAMSTAWIDELPFLTAPQIFNGWSAGLGVNLLVANYHKVASGELGSGIFRGATWQASDYTYDHNGGTTLLVGTVSTLVTVPTTHASGVSQGDRDSQEGVSEQADGAGNTEDSSHQPPSSAAVHFGGTSQQLYPMTVLKEIQDDYYKYIITDEGDYSDTFSERPSYPDSKVEEMQTKVEYIFIHEDLGRYNHKVLERSEEDILFIQTLCHNDSLCCTIEYTYPFNEKEEGLYMILAYSGVVEKGGGVYLMFTQVCAIVFCLTDDVSSCALVGGENPEVSSFRAHNLSGTFATPYVYPSVFTQDLKLVNETFWTYSYFISNGKRNLQISLDDNVHGLLSLTMLGRWYERDPEV